MYHELRYHWRLRQHHFGGGASPIMAEDIREVKEIVAISGAVVLNIGTLQEQTVKAMRLAGEEANRLNIPVVLILWAWAQAICVMKRRKMPVRKCEIQCDSR